MLHPNRTQGLVAQWITRLTSDQKIAGSSPAEIGPVFMVKGYEIHPEVFPLTKDPLSILQQSDWQKLHSNMGNQTVKEASNTEWP